jgi:hypothetical protein
VVDYLIPAARVIAGTKQTHTGGCKMMNYIFGLGVLLLFGIVYELEYVNIRLKKLVDLLEQADLDRKLKR